MEGFSCDTFPSYDVPTFMETLTQLTLFFTESFNTILASAWRCPRKANVSKADCHLDQFYCGHTFRVKSDYVSYW